MAYQEEILASSYECADAERGELFQILRGQNCETQTLRYVSAGCLKATTTGARNFVHFLELKAKMSRRYHTFVRSKEARSS